MTRAQRNEIFCEGLTTAPAIPEQGYTEEEINELWWAHYETQKGILTQIQRP